MKLEPYQYEDLYKRFYDLIEELAKQGHIDIEDGYIEEDAFLTFNLTSATAKARIRRTIQLMLDDLKL